MKSYCVDFGEGKFFNLDAERFEICESGYCFFYRDEHIVCSVNWDRIKEIDEHVRIDNRYYSLKVIWTYENGFAVKT